MEKFIVYERQEFKNTFRKYDEDDSNSINLEELRKLIKDRGRAERPHPQRSLLIFLNWMR